MRLSAAVLLLLLASCGQKESSAVDAAYQPWKQRNFILSQTFSGGATLEGSITVNLSRDACVKDDWFEAFVNGREEERTTDPNCAQFTFETKFRPGPNWIILFSSASKMGWEFNVDARQGTRFEFTPKDKQEWTMNQVKDE